MLDLSPFRVVVFVFGMPECWACENYLPRFQACLAARGAKRQPFWTYDPETSPTAPSPRAIPVLFLDASSEDPQISGLADRVGVTGTPCTVVMPLGARSATDPRPYNTFLKHEGALPTENIEQILDAALELAKR